jgi:hypothetical protein
VIEDQLLMNAFLGTRSGEHEKVLDTVSFPFPIWKGGWAGLVCKVMGLVFDSLGAFAVSLEMVDSGIDTLRIRQVNNVFGAWFEEDWFMEMSCWNGVARYCYSP